MFERILLSPQFLLSSDTTFRRLRMKPLFTLHAGEFLVDTEIEWEFRRVNVWIPAKDTGIDLLVSNYANSVPIKDQGASLKIAASTQKSVHSVAARR
jgi:hypothetical protein